MIAIFNPQGPIASQERDLIVTLISIMLVIVVPTLIAFFVVMRKYRAGNKAAYEPDGKHHVASEIVLWLMPAVIIGILAVITWKITHVLDPYKPISGQNPPMTVQVVALDWKWLFIYPQQGIATVNFLEFPEQTPLNFQLTADNAPMNSFWIPQLGGQIYAMAGMSTQTHLMASDIGEYQGSAAEINGPGFAGMRFIAKSVTPGDFNAWVASVKQSSAPLTANAYDTLAQPSANVAPVFYSSIPDNLYNGIVMKVMPTSSTGMPMMPVPNHN